MGGFCDELLPTDRPHFSSADGLEDRPRNSFKLPSLDSWQWESDWQIENTFENELLDPQVRPRLPLTFTLVNPTKNCFPSSGRVRPAIPMALIFFPILYSQPVCSPLTFRILGMDICLGFPRPILPGEVLEVLCPKEKMVSNSSIYWFQSMAPYRANS